MATAGSSIPEWVSHDFLRLYLQYTEFTEPPQMMHLWSAVCGISACLGRKCKLDVHLGDMFPNMYVLLVGPPGTRKSTAINTMTKFLRKETEVQFAPDDTSGQRQGLIAAMQTADEEELKDELDLLDGLGFDEQMEKLKNVKVKVNHANRHHMFIAASEFGSFLGQNNLALTRFLIKMWDGETYTYQLKKSKVELEEGLLTMIGGTTATDISMLLPPEAIGQGFMSRIILVYEAKKSRRIPPSKAGVKPELYDAIAERFREADKMEGVFTFSKIAAELSDEIYMQDSRINDTRFIYYAERRHTHLLKLACCLAAARGSMEIDEIDIDQAELMLSITEETMPEALGEYGLSPLASAKQKLLEFIQHANGPVTDRVLWLVMQRDMRMVDFRNSLAEMINANKIISIKTKNGMAFLYNDKLQEAIELLSEEPLEELLETEEDSKVVKMDEAVEHLADRELGKKRS